MVYSGVRASEYLYIIIIAKPFTVRRQIGIVPFFDLLQTSSTVTAPASVYLLSQVVFALNTVQYLNLYRKAIIEVEGIVADGAAHSKGLLDAQYGHNSHDV
jgi:hypothetical protein